MINVLPLILMSCINKISLINKKLTFCISIFLLMLMLLIVPSYSFNIQKTNHSLISENNIKLDLTICRDYLEYDKDKPYTYFVESPYIALEPQNISVYNGGCNFFSLIIPKTNQYLVKVCQNQINSICKEELLYFDFSFRPFEIVNKLDVKRDCDDLVCKFTININVNEINDLTLINIIVETNSKTYFLKNGFVNITENINKPNPLILKIYPSTTKFENEFYNDNGQIELRQKSEDVFIKTYESEPLEPGTIATNSNEDETDFSFFNVVGNMTLPQKLLILLLILVVFANMFINFFKIGWKKWKGKKKNPEK
jgi:hypothetical protein